MLVLDASIALSWCFPDEQTNLSIAVLDRLQFDEALVPAFWSVEVLNALIVGEKKGRISPEQTQAFLGDLRSLAPEVDCIRLEDVFGIVQAISRDHRLSPYDALYVELALRSNCPFATLDRAQRAAAEALGVHCL